MMLCSLPVLHFIIIESISDREEREKPRAPVCYIQGLALNRGHYILAVVIVIRMITTIASADTNLRIVFGPAPLLSIDSFPLSNPSQLPDCVNLILFGFIGLMCENLYCYLLSWQAL